MIRLVNPVVTLNFHQIRSRGRKLPPAAEEFTSFLKNYIADGQGVRVFFRHAVTGSTL